MVIPTLDMNMNMNMGMPMMDNLSLGLTSKL